MGRPVKTLGEKWGIMPWLKIRIEKDPPWLQNLVLPFTEDTKLVRQGVCDLAFVAPTSAAEWKQKARRLRPAIDPDGAIWVLYPKDEYREKYNFDGSLEEMIHIVKELGLRHTKLASVNDELTSVRFTL
ncbi:MAG: hypothetical protein M5R41_00690 [Bacteroidia bacterium]|nr:hypothetical protein [Bacteroidia bacterium]